MTKRVAAIYLFLLAAILGACGYRGQEALPNDLKRIHLTITTGLFQPGLEAQFTQALTRRILSSGGQVVKDKSLADATIQGNIAALENNPVAFDAQDIATRFRTVVVLDLQVIQQNGKVELAKEKVRGEAYYSAPSGITGTEVARNDAIRRALFDLANKVVGRVAEPF
ncbi:MAG: LPS assembly lipoprotein LptE [Candidatus Methylomirabilales bacterium]